MSIIIDYKDDIFYFGINDAFVDRLSRNNARKIYYLYHICTNELKINNNVYTKGRIGNLKIIPSSRCCSYCTKGIDDLNYDRYASYEDPLLNEYIVAYNQGYKYTCPAKNTRYIEQYDKFIDDSAEKLLIMRYMASEHLLLDIGCIVEEYFIRKIDNTEEYYENYNT